MPNRQWERIGFLALLCAIFAVVAWVLISGSSSQISEAQNDVVLGDSVIESQIQPIRDEAAEARKALQTKQAADEALKLKQTQRLKRRESLKVSIPVYASRVGSEKAFTSFTGWSDLIVIDQVDATWSKVASARGFPVWISASLAESLGKGYVRVKSTKVNLRSIPQVKGSRVLGRARAGDIMKVNRKQGDWLRVWSSISITAWAKSAQLIPQNAVSSSVETAM